MRTSQQADWGGSSILEHKQHGRNRKLDGVSRMDSTHSGQRMRDALRLHDDQGKRQDKLQRFLLLVPQHQKKVAQQSKAASPM